MIDVVVYNEPKFKEIWYLLVPSGSRNLLPAEEVVRLYQERMQIEQSFRDFKTHLGLRGLRLQVDVVARMGRLLLAFLLAYTLCILLGESELGQKAREVFEVPRLTPRHGTTRTLSALMIAMLMLSHPDFRDRCIRILIRIINRVSNGSTWINKKLLAIPNRSPT
ncbi:MAG: transposase [Nitrospirae bacterium]|nr:transposase [Nitrospirota bacterium]